MTWLQPVGGALGYKPEQLIGISAFQYMHRDYVAGARAALARMAETPGWSHPVQFRYKANDGSWRYLEATGRTLNPTSVADGIVVNSRDITDRKQAEDALRASEESYRGLFDSLTELVYLQDLEGRFLNVNDAVLRAYGYTREDLIGRTPDILADPTRVDLEDTLRRFGEAVAGKPQRFEWWGRRKDGSTFPKELVLTRSTYFGREAVIAVTRDITERKRAEEALQEATQEAEAANRAKSEFLSRMSHELRTPMNSILGFAQLLARKELPGDQKKGVDHIPKAGGHLLNLLPQGESPMARLVREGIPASRPAELARGKPATVLYVEDNLANLSLVESILAARPEITLVPALQGRLGLDLAWEHQPDLVLLDLHLPDIPGEKVLRYLKSDARTRHTPVIISADATPGTVERLLQEGADGYLTKPLDVDQFLGTIQTMLNQPAS